MKTWLIDAILMISQNFFVLFRVYMPQYEGEGGCLAGERIRRLTEEEPLEERSTEGDCLAGEVYLMIRKV